MKTRISTIVNRLYAIAVIATTGVLVAIALLHTTSDTYTTLHQSSYICLAIAGTIAYLTALFTAKNSNIVGWLLIAIELYLAGIIFQLFSLF